MAPSQDQLSALARQALAQLSCEGQATVWWERRLAVGEHGVSEVVQRTAELVVLRDGRVGAASTTDLSDDGLRRAAAAAEAHAALDREPVGARRLPDPAAGRPNEGWDPSVVALDPATVADDLAELTGGGLVVEWRRGAARIAIASTRGIAALEQRSFCSAEVHAPGRPLAAAVGPAAAIELGVFLPAFLAGEHGWLLDGAQLIEAGEPTWPVNGVVEVDPIAVLAATDALTAGQRRVPTDDDSALTIGATLAPALRASAGVTIVG